ncbi:MAG: hypothetical protein ACFFDS_05200 [Candidatus Thorarchaeota archaeon]
MKRDPLIIGTASVLVIAFTLSLLNIYVFPNIFYNIDIYRNTDNQTQLDLLYSVERINLNSSIFNDINSSKILLSYPERQIINVSLMIDYSLLHLSAAYDYLTANAPKRIRFKYNGTINGAANNSDIYENWIRDDFDNGGIGNYFCFLNSSLQYEVYSNFAGVDLASYSETEIISNLEEIFANPDRRPDFVIYQKITYFESRGFLSEFSTEFERIVFVNIFGDIIFFLSNEGVWIEPLFLS